MSIFMILWHNPHTSACLAWLYTDMTLRPSSTVSAILFIYYPPRLSQTYLPHWIGNWFITDDMGNNHCQFLLAAPTVRATISRCKMYSCDARSVTSPSYIKVAISKVQFPSWPHLADYTMTWVKHITERSRLHISAKWSGCWWIRQSILGSWSLSLTASNFHNTKEQPL
jgi:hypothetical protein